MPCHAAMIANPPALDSNISVDLALEFMAQRGVDYAPVLNDDGQPVGLFSYRGLLKNILPVSVSMGGGANMDLTVRAAPGMAKRLKKVGVVSVSEVMDRKFGIVYPDTPTWEGINILTAQGQPLLVVDRETGKLQGMVNHQSALAELQRLKQEQ